MVVEWALYGKGKARHSSYFLPKTAILTKSKDFLVVKTFKKISVPSKSKPLTSGKVGLGHLYLVAAHNVQTFNQNLP